MLCCGFQGSGDFARFRRIGTGRNCLSPNSSWRLAPTDSVCPLDGTRSIWKSAKSNKCHRAPLVSLGVFLTKIVGCLNGGISKREKGTQGPPEWSRPVLAVGRESRSWGPVSEFAFETSLELPGLVRGDPSSVSGGGDSSPRCGNSVLCWSTKLFAGWLRQGRGNHHLKRRPYDTHHGEHCRHPTLSRERGWP